MTRTDGNRLAAEFIAGLEWERLPESVSRRARICLLDGGRGRCSPARLPRSAASPAHTRPNRGAATWRPCSSTTRKGDCTGSGQARRARRLRMPVPANALDIDDDAIFTRGHPGAQLVPTVLAVGEKIGASGREVLEALVVGYEIAIRAGHCWHAHHTDYQADGSWGSMACAAAAARLLRLDPEQIGHALGIAEYHAPNVPMMRDIAEPGDGEARDRLGRDDRRHRRPSSLRAATPASRASSGSTSTTIGSRTSAERGGWRTGCSTRAGRRARGGTRPAWQRNNWSFRTNYRSTQIAAIRVRTFAEAVALHHGYPIDD